MNRDEVLNVVHKRNAKRFRCNFLDALKNAVEAMKRLRNETRQYFDHMKFVARHESDWQPRGAVECDYAAIVVTGAMVQGRVHLIAFLVDQMRRFGVDGPTVDRLTKSAMLYLRETLLVATKAQQMIQVHYNKGEGDVQDT